MIAVYVKQPNGLNTFLTTCKLTADERTHLKATKGNFLTQKMIERQRLQQTSTIESLSMNIGPTTSTTSVNANSSPNPGFTPIDTFESDVTGISPIKNPESNEF